jgi:hypothetical protein
LAAVVSDLQPGDFYGVWIFSPRLLLKVVVAGKSDRRFFWAEARATECG